MVVSMEVPKRQILLIPALNYSSFEVDSRAQRVIETSLRFQICVPGFTSCRSFK
jgi:hypothetical protein